MPRSYAKGMSLFSVQQDRSPLVVLELVSQPLLRGLHGGATFWPPDPLQAKRHPDIFDPVMTEERSCGTDSLFRPPDSDPLYVVGGLRLGQLMRGQKPKSFVTLVKRSVSSYPTEAHRRRLGIQSTPWAADLGSVELIVRIVLLAARCLIVFYSDVASGYVLKCFLMWSSSHIQLYNG